MKWQNKAAALAAAWVLACGAAVAGPQAARVDHRLHKPQPTAEARDMAQWILRTRDAGGLPFLVVDKKAAQLYVFNPDGRMTAATPVLLGAARGDEGVPGAGEHAQSGTLPFEERTTPAGRFLTHPGRNSEGEAVIWFDYEAALAIHRLRPGRAHAIRAARLEKSEPSERRVSLGCVVVPVKFYLGVIEPLLGRRAGVVYVLPETYAAREMLDL